ncbi:MAG: outer membrane beta-barrel protein [Rikenellaceae bacterium]
MKKFFLLAAMLFASSALFAQTSTVKGNLVDSYTAEGVIGAIVELEPLGSTKQPTLTTSGYDGAFTFNSMSYGKYRLTATYMGYHDYTDTIEVNSPRLILDKLRIKEASTEIDAVVKEVQAMRTSQRGDTLSYSASAYKVANDADVEGLLKKMPGITISDDGEVTAQGETIQKIFVDGREFFGSDVTTAISSLPAELVESIEVYDKLSDNAELSGMDDGDGYKAINIVTKSNMREGFFGKMYAGGGYQPVVDGDTDHGKYLVGGNVNYFTGKHRFTVLALFNNINQQNFSFDDILGVSDSSSGASEYMVRPQSGVATVNALGLNYSGAFGSGDKVKVEGSYFYNGTQTENVKTISKWYESPLSIDTLTSETVSSTPNHNHRITGRLEWKITPTQQLTVRQNVSFQYNDAESTTTGAMWGESGYSLLDSYSLADKGGYSSSTSVSYATRLGKPGRTLSVNGSLSLRRQDNITYSYSNGAAGYTDGTVYAIDTAALMLQDPSLLRDLYYTAVFNPTETVTVSGNVTYAEPIGTGTQLTFKYAYSNKEQDTEKNTYATDESYNYDAATDWQSASSNHYETTYITHQVGPGIYYSDGKSKITANVNYQLSELTGDVVLAGSDTSSESIEHYFNNITYTASGQLYFNPTNSLRLRVYSKTSEPWVGRLVDAYSLSDVQYISHGNPNLVPSYNTTVRMHYIRSNIEKGSTFMIMGGLDNQQDYIGEHVVYYPDTFEVDGVSYSPIEYSTYVNLDEYWSYMAMMEYGFPISPIKCNFNIRGTAKYTLTPSMFGGTINSDTGLIDGGELNNNESMTYGLTTVLGSNISENVDFTLSWNGEYSETTNSASTTDDANTYLSQTASASMKFVLPFGFTFTGAATYKEYVGITNDYQESYLLCNTFFGKKIFANKRGELNFGVNDIFDQNTSFTRSVGTGYTQNTYNSVIGRYYSVQLVYNLRSFGNQKGEGDGERRGPGAGGPPSGGGRGMGGPPMM